MYYGGRSIKQLIVRAEMYMLMRILYNHYLDLPMLEKELSCKFLGDHNEVALLCCAMFRLANDLCEIIRLLGNTRYSCIAYYLIIL